MKDYDDKWLFIINDMISYCGEDISRKNKIIRIKYMYELLVLIMLFKTFKSIALKHKLPSNTIAELGISS